MATLRIRSPKYAPRDRDLGPCLARPTAFDALRQRLDVALSKPHRRPLPIDLEQP